MTAIVNTKLPQVGELLVHRLIVQFKKAFKRNDKAVSTLLYSCPQNLRASREGLFVRGTKYILTMNQVCLSAVTFIAHLTNQQVRRLLGVRGTMAYTL